MKLNGLQKTKGKKMKKATLNLTDAQMGLLRIALTTTIESNEELYSDDCKRDSQAAADYRGFKKLLEMIDANRIQVGA